MDINYLPECTTEDSIQCYWDATVQGNGQGQSFVNYDGQTIAYSVPENHYTEAVAIPSDGIPAFVFQEYADIVYQFDITPIVTVAIAGIVASIAIGITAFVKRAR